MSIISRRPKSKTLGIVEHLPKRAVYNRTVRKCHHRDHLVKMSSFIVSSVMARTAVRSPCSELLPERLLFSLDFSDLLKLIDALGEPLVFTTQPLELAALSRIWLGSKDHFVGAESRKEDRKHEIEERGRRCRKFGTRSGAI